MDTNPRAEAGDIIPGSTRDQVAPAEVSKESQGRPTSTQPGAKGDQKRTGLRSMDGRTPQIVSSYAEAAKTKTGGKTHAKKDGMEQTRAKTAQMDNTRAEAFGAETLRAGPLRADGLRTEGFDAEGLRPDGFRADELSVDEPQMGGHMLKNLFAAEEARRGEAAAVEASLAEERLAEERLAEERLAEARLAEARFAEVRLTETRIEEERLAKTGRADRAHADELRAEEIRACERRKSTDSGSRGNPKVEEQMRSSTQFSNLFQCLDKRGRSGDSRQKSPQPTSQNSSPGSQRNSGTVNRSSRNVPRNGNPAQWDQRQPEEERYRFNAFTDSSVGTGLPSAAMGPSEVTLQSAYGNAGGLPPPQWGSFPTMVPPQGVPQASASAATHWSAQPNPYTYGVGGMPYWNMGWNPQPAAPPTKSPEIEALEKQMEQIRQRAEEAEIRQKEAEVQRKILQDRMEVREREIRKKLEEAEAEFTRRRMESVRPTATADAGLLTVKTDQTDQHPDQNLFQSNNYYSPGSSSGVNRNGNHHGNHYIKMKPDRFDGVKTEWPEYKKYFEITASLQGWNSREKAQCLAVSLSGQAQSVLIGMSEIETMSYETIVQRLEAKYDPAGRELAHRAELRNLKRKPDQGPAEWASLVERLVTRAYPESHGRTLEITVLEHFLSGITDPTTRHWLELKAIKTVPEAINNLIHYESVMTTPKGEMTRKPREIVAVVEDSEESQDIGSGDQMVAVVNGGPSGNAYPQRYSGQQSSGQNNKQGYRSSTPKPAYQGTNPTPRPVWQGQPTPPASGSPAANPLGKEPFPNKGIVQMFRAQEKQMGSQNQTMSGHGEKLDLVLRALEEILSEKKNAGSPVNCPVEKSPPQMVEKKSWEKSTPIERKCWRCQQPGHMIRDCPVETSVIAALEAGLERTVEPKDIGDQLAEN